MLDEQSVIKYGSMFLQLDRNVTIDRIKKLIGKKIYMDVINDDNATISNYFATIESISENNTVIFNHVSRCCILDDDNSELSFFDITKIIRKLKLSNIRALEEIKNYNTRNFDFDKLMNKKILLTNMHDRQEIVVIHDYEVSLHLYAEDNNHNVYETYDYDFPKCFIKDIEIIDE